MVPRPFSIARRCSLATDRDDAPVFLARNTWEPNRTIKDWPDHRFLKMKERI